MEQDLNYTLILDFLKLEFPKKRIKSVKSNRFKAGVVINGSYTKAETIRLSLKNDIEQIINVLYEIIYAYFGTGEPHKIKETIFNYLL